MIVKQCPACGKNFKLSPVEAKKETFCSWSCRYNPVHRFLKRVMKTDTCWLWTGRLGRGGYGAFDWKGTSIYAHRAAYELFVGEIPEGLDILHSCDNRRCVNPAHLRPGTHLDNMRDMYSKNRRQCRLGEDHPNSKLTWEQVNSIRQEYAAGGTTFQKLGRKYQVDQTLIHRIVRGIAWKTSYPISQSEA